MYLKSKYVVAPSFWICMAIASIYTLWGHVKSKNHEKDLLQKRRTVAAAELKKLSSEETIAVDKAFIRNISHSQIETMVKDELLTQEEGEKLVDQSTKFEITLVPASEPTESENEQNQNE